MIACEPKVVYCGVSAALHLVLRFPLYAPNFVTSHNSCAGQCYMVPLQQLSMCSRNLLMNLHM